MANGNYELPVGIDYGAVLEGINAIDEGLAGLQTNAKNATTSMSNVFMEATKGGDALVMKINAGADAAKKLQVAAQTAGGDIEKAFGGGNVDTKGLTDKVNTFVAKMKDVIGKPVDFKFNLDQTAINLLISKLKDAKGQVSSFELVIATAKSELNKMAAGSDAFNKLEKQIQDADKFLNVLKEDIVDVKDEIESVPDAQIDPVPVEAEPKVTSLRQQLRAMREELARMELAGEAGSEAFIRLSRDAGELQDQIGDTSQRIQRLASDTKGLDAITAGVRGLAGAFAIGQGALAAFGEQNEEAAKAIQKVQGAMAILQGVQELANVLNKDSALSVYLQTFATQAHTTAVVADTVAVEAEAVATETATAATDAWTVALLANPITAIIAAVAALVAGLYFLAKAHKDAGLSADEFNKILETQKRLLDEDYARVNRSTEIAAARAEAARKQASVLTGIQINALKQQELYNKIEIDETIRHIAQLDTEDKKYAETKKAALDHITEIENKNRDLAAQGVALEIKMQRQKIDEDAKLNLEILKARFSNNEANRALLEEARKYAVDIQAAKTSELQEGLAKELAVLKAGTEEKVKALSAEGDAKLRQLQEQRRELDFDVDTNKKVLALQKSGLDQQISQERKNLQERNALQAALIEAGEVERLRIIEKYRSQQAEFDLQIQAKLLDLQKESEAKKLALLTNSAELEIEQIRAQNMTKENEQKAIDAVLKKLDKDMVDASLKSAQDQIELDKQNNVNRVNESKAFSSKAEGVVTLKNIALLQLEQDAAAKQLAALKKAGKDETDAEYATAKARLDAATDAVNEAIRKKPAKSLLSIMLPDATPEQLANIEQNIQRTFSSIGQAVDSYYQLVNDRYQKIIDIKKAAVAQDEENISTLEDQLTREQDLRAQGYANNVDGINTQLAAATAAREKDIQEQEEAQKRLAKSQKAQADAQTALQAANLITASTNIYLQATAVGGPVAVPIAIAAIAAMIGAFVLSKAKAAEAVQTTQFGGGGEISGKSHAQGGEKYFAADGSATVMELEDGEYVTNKKATEKYRPLLEVINNNGIDGMSDAALSELLNGLGISFAHDDEHDNALQEARVYAAAQVNNININPATPPELKRMDDNLQAIAMHHANQITTYEEGDYVVTKKGNKTVRTLKK